MIKTKRYCSPLRLANIRTLKARGLTYREIGIIYGVSGVQVMYWLNGRNVKHLRKNPGKCEICGRTGRLNHHHWDDPTIGMWLCSRCHIAVDALEKIPGFAPIYFELKSTVQLMFTSNLDRVLSSAE